MRIIKRSYLIDVLLARIGLLLISQRANKIFQGLLSARGITTSDDIFERLFVIGV